MTLRAVLLDYDLTLINNMMDFYEAYNETLKKFVGKTISFEKFYILLNNNSLESLLPATVDKVSFWRYFRKVYRTRTGWPNKGVEYFLYWVKSMGVKTIIISGRECHVLNIFLELRRFGLDEYIDEIYTIYNLYIMGGREHELFDKTSLITYVLSRYGLHNEEVVYIGDYRQDLLSSIRAGVRFVGIAFSKERMECLYGLGAEYVGMDFYDVFYYIASNILKN